MKFGIYQMSSSGQKFETKKEFLCELEKMIDDCIANGGTHFDGEVIADASCFLVEEETEE